MDRTPEPGDRPPPRRLDRAPGERYREAASEPTATRPNRAGPRRGLGPALAAGLLGAVLIVVLGGVAAVSLGLLVVAALIGWLVAEALGPGMAAGRRSGLAPAIAVGAVVIGQIGLWLLALAEGGALGLVDYLGQVFGWLVPAELVVAGAAAWWSTR